MRERGKTNREIAAQLGCSHLTVSQWFSDLRRDGVEVPLAPYQAARRTTNNRNVKIDVEQMERALELRERGETYPAIVERLGLGVSASGLGDAIRAERSRR